jgi:hypothetical protein
MSRVKDKSPKKTVKEGDAREVSPWLKGVAKVKGVVPPGRRLSPPSEKRTTRWSASGVKGVRPPGKQKIGAGRVDVAAEKEERKRVARGKANERALQRAKGAERNTKRPGPEEAKALDQGRPVAGFQPDPFHDAKDPADLKTFLEQIAEFMQTIEISSNAIESLSELIIKSHAPYEITVAFTILSMLAGKDPKLRRRYARAIERGAKAFYNLARRLDPEVRAPRGLVPESLDAIFYDLPATAYQVPLAFATAAFLRTVELFQGERDNNKKLIRFAVDLRERYIEKRSAGDQPLAVLFPWDPPDWAPRLD